MPAPSAVRSSALHASSLAASPFSSPLYASAAHSTARYEEKESGDGQSIGGKQARADTPHGSGEWRPHSAGSLRSDGGRYVDGGEWALSPIQTAGQSSQSSSHRPVTPMSPLVLPLSTLHSRSARQAPAPVRPASASSSPFASVHSSPRFQPSQAQHSAATRPKQAAAHSLTFDTPPSRPSESPRLSALHEHSASHTHLPQHPAHSGRAYSHGRSRSSLSDVCPSPVLSPATTPSLHSQYAAPIPALSLEQQPHADERLHGKRGRPTVEAAAAQYGEYAPPLAWFEQPHAHSSGPSRSPRARSLRSAAAASHSRWLSSLSSCLRGSRVLLFVAVVSGVVLFQVLCALWLLPSDSTGLPALPRSASIARLERSQHSARQFQQSHAGHEHAQHRDDEALRQAVADLQEHVRAHRTPDSHTTNEDAHEFEQRARPSVEQAGGNAPSVHRGIEPSDAAQLQQPAIDLIDAEQSWK